MKQCPLLTIAASMLLLSGCDKAPMPQEAQQELIERSATMADDLQSTLGPQLKNALQNGGVEQAVLTCQQIAQPLTEQLSKQYTDAHISRVALRARNPDNQADTVATNILEQWSAALAKGEALPKHVLTEGKNVTLVHQPILTQEMCLKCHGNPETFSLELKHTLATHYPYDQATDFKVGELRGAFRIEFPSK